MPEIHLIQQSHEAPQATVVFVHGSGGHYLKDWGPTDPSDNWIYWIGADNPQVDVLSVQHEGNLWSLTDYATLTDYAAAIGFALNRLLRSERIIFVGYSLGGIIIKELLILGGEDRKLDRVSKTACDCCFIATPHLGGNFYFMRKAIKYSPNRIVGMIFGLNEGIQNINDKFLRIQRPKIENILCFPERRRYFGMNLGRKIIPDTSGEIQDSRARNIGISKGHKLIPSLKSRGDVIYIGVDGLCKRDPNRTLVGERNFEIEQKIVDRLISR